MSEKYDLLEPVPLDSIEEFKIIEEKYGTTLEQIKMRVMSMVVPLAESGFGFTTLRPGSHTEIEDREDFQTYVDTLQDVLKYGLLGLFSFSKDINHSGSQTDDIGRKFVTLVKENKPGVVMGNIFGRDIGFKEYSGYGTSLLGYWQNQISVVYDISGKEEIMPGFGGNTKLDEKAGATKTKQMWFKHGGAPEYAFKAREDGPNALTLKEARILCEIGIISPSNNSNYDEFVTQVKNHEGDIRNYGCNYDALLYKLLNSKDFSDLGIGPDSDNGFVLGRRIAPRKFKGLIITRELQKGERYTDLKELKPEECDKVTKILKLFTKKFIEEGKDVFLPIYDNAGNLVWPEYIPYESIVKMSEGYQQE